MTKRTHQFKKSLIVGAMTLALSACLSDSDDSDNKKPESNSAPTITSTASTSVDQHSEYTYTITADDADNDALTIDVTTLPAWLTFDADNLTLQGTPGLGDDGTHDVVVSVSDGTDTVTQSFSITVNSVNRSPDLMFSEITGEKEGDAFEVTVTASDPDGDTLTLSATSLPDWLTFDATTGVLSGTAGSDDAGSYTIKISVSDGTVQLSETLTIEVEDVPDETMAPVALTVYEDAANPQWAAWDCCGGSTATIEDDGSDYGNVTQFTINGATVVGFTARDSDGAVNGTTFNASNLKDDGTLEFDLKLVTAPAGTPNWLLKVESDGAATFGEVSLSTAEESHASPEVGVWQHYTFKLADLEAAGLDLGKIDVVMVFPAWGEGDGTVFRLDNVVFRGTGDTTNPDPDPTEEPTPTTGDLVIYENVIQPNWIAWDCCGGSTPSSMFESDTRGEVTEFTIAGSGETVLGYSTRAAHGATNGVAHDATSIVEAGTLSFDLKMTSSPGETDWKLKVESNGGTGFVEVNLSTANEGHAAPVLDTWQTYTFNLKDLQAAGAATGLDVSAIDVVMMFPAWGTGSGAVYRVDNVKINSTGATMSTKPSLPLDFESATFTYVLTDFGGAASEVVADPDSTNVRGKVAKTIKTDSAETWAGTTTSGPDGLAEAVPLTAEKTTMKLWVYSPKVGATVRLKLEDATDGTRSVETDAVTTMADGWEQLTFDFANQAEGTAALNLDYTYDKASVFFNFGVTGADAGELTFYWDALMMAE